MLQDTVDKVALAPPPHTKKTAASLFRPKKLFIEKYAEIAAPLTDALKGGKSSPWKWEHSQAVAFSKLKELLCAKPILRLPDMEKTFYSADRCVRCRVGSRIVARAVRWHVSGCLRKPQVDQGRT